MECPPSGYARGGEETTTMADYLANTQVNVGADAVFDYLADVSHLPAYFPRMTSAEPGDGEAVRVTAQLDGGREVTGEAWFHVDREAHTLAWGSEGPNDYHGRLVVEGVGDNAGIALRVSTARVESDEVQHDVDETMEKIKTLLEGDQT
jgi:uncharacterized membrane protein